MNSRWQLLESGGTAGRGRYFRLSRSAYDLLLNALQYHVDRRVSAENAKARVLTALADRPLTNADTILNDRNSMNIINIREKPEYVLGVLNSRLVSWWFIHKFGKMQRETFPQFKVNELADFPMPKNGEKHRDEIAKLAGQILAAKQRDADADTTALEQDRREAGQGLTGWCTSCTA